MEDNPLREIINGLMGHVKTKSVPICLLSGENKKLMEELDVLAHKITSLHSELVTKKEYFWAKVKMDLKLYDVTIFYDSDTGMLMQKVEVKDEEEEEPNPDEEGQ